MLVNSMTKKKKIAGIKSCCHLWRLCSFLSPHLQRSHLNKFSPPIHSYAQNITPPRFTILHSVSLLHLPHWNHSPYVLSPVSCLLMRLWENCGEGLVDLGMIWPAGVSPWAQRPLHRSIMRTLMAVKWLARNEKLPSSVRVMVSLGPRSPFKGNSLRCVGFLCVPAHVNYRQWQTISCFTRTSPRSCIIATRAAVPG